MGLSATLHWVEFGAHLRVPQRVDIVTLVNHSHWFHSVVSDIFLVSCVLSVNLIASFYKIMALVLRRCFASVAQRRWYVGVTCVCIVIDFCIIIYTLIPHSISALETISQIQSFVVVATRIHLDLE